MLGKEPKREDKINQYIRERIREAREERGKSQEDLAKALYKSRVAVSDMERGRVEVSAADLVFIANDLEKPITYFYDRAVIDPQQSDLSPKEKELVYLFRQLSSDLEEDVAIAQLRVLADAELRASRQAWLEAGKQEAEKRGWTLP